MNRMKIYSNCICEKSWNIEVLTTLKKSHQVKNLCCFKIQKKKMLPESELISEACVLLLTSGIKKQSPCR